MSEAFRPDGHIADATLWQLREQELEARANLAIIQHVQHCAECQLRAEHLHTALREMRTQHYAAQPSLAQQLHLLTALQTEFEMPPRLHALAETCQNLVRWLAPALAILATIFVLWREETLSTANSASLESLLSQSREEQLLMTSDEAAAPQAFIELAFAGAEK